MHNKISDADFLRYVRQISVPEFGEAGQVKLAYSRVLIIGCGGLGTLVSSYLVNCGIGALTISDDDQVEMSNLPRQLNYRSTDIGCSKVVTLKRSLLELVPSCRIRTLDKRMDEVQLALELQLADVVIDCSDNFDTRFLVNRLCSESKTPLISGSAIGWVGQLATYTYQESEPCYQCLITPDSIEEGQNNCESAGVIAPVVGVIASIQATEAIKLLALPDSLNKHLGTTLVAYDGLTLNFERYQIEKNGSCEICSGRVTRSFV